MTIHPLIWQASNLFVGDHDPSASNHLVLEEIKLPSLEENMQDHHPGGAPVGVEFGVGIKKLEPTFKTKGYQPHIITQFGLGTPVRRTFTVYSAYQDKKSGRFIECKAIIEGRLGKAEGDAGKRGELVGHEYAINEVMHYEVFFDGAEHFYWDFFTNTWRVAGTSQNADINRILRIPGAG